VLLVSFEFGGNFLLYGTVGAVIGLPPQKTNAMVLVNEVTADVDLSPGLPTARVKAMSENVGNIVVEAMQPEMTLGLLLSRNSTRQTQVGIDIFQGPASNKSMKSDHSTQA